jgi:hypothetical protein
MNIIQRGIAPDLMSRSSIDFHCPQIRQSTHI